MRYDYSFSQNIHMVPSLRNSGYVQHFLDVSSTRLHEDEQKSRKFRLMTLRPISRTLAQRVDCHSLSSRTPPPFILGLFTHADRSNEII